MSDPPGALWYFRKPLPRWARLAALAIGTVVFLGPIVLAFVRLSWHGPLPPRVASKSAPDTGTTVSAFYEALRPVSKEEYRAVWFREAEGPEESAQEVLQRLAREMGMELKLGGFAKQAGRKISPRSGSRLELIDEAARAIGLSTRLSATPTRFSLGGDGVKKPIAFAGPFQVEGLVTDENFPTATGTLLLSVRVLPNPLLASVLDCAPPTMETTEIVSSTGANLSHATRHKSERAPEGTPDGVNGWTWKVPLKDLLADVDRLKRVQGRINVPRPDRVVQVRVDLDRPEQSVRFGQAVLVARIEGQIAVELNLSGSSSGVVCALIKNEDHGVLGAYRSSLAPGRPARFVLPPGGAAVEVKLAETVAEAHEFTLWDVATLKRPPVRHAPLAHPGHPGPASAVASRKGSDWELELTNRSNHPIDEVGYRLTFRDKAGRALGSVDGSYRFSGKKAPVRIVGTLAPLMARRVSLKGVQIPGKTDHIDVEVFRAELANGETWRGGDAPPDNKAAPRAPQ